MKNKYSKAIKGVEAGMNCLDSEILKLYNKMKYDKCNDIDEYKIFYDKTVELETMWEKLDNIRLELNKLE